MKISERIAKLIDVKSLVTLLLTGMFMGLCAMEKISGEQFLTVFTVVISFYFGVQMERKKGGPAGESETHTAAK